MSQANVEKLKRRTLVGVRCVGKTELVKPFLLEVTKELLYNIVSNHRLHSIDYSSLYNEFNEKTGHEPTIFFGFGNVSGQEWPDFLNNVPGLERTQGRRRQVRITDSVDVGRAMVYRQNNTTYLNGDFKETIAAYRERFLVMSCKMIKKNFPNLNRCKDKMDNTPLHLIAALPGHYVQSDGTVPLVKYLIQAGVDPMILSSNRRNFLHTISWSFVEEDMGYVNRWVSENEYFYYFICTINSVRYMKERSAILNTLLVKLTPEQLHSLVSTKDSLGNTVVHGWAHLMSILNVEDDFQPTSSFLNKLFSFDTRTDCSDEDVDGSVALHYAFHPKVFKIFLLKKKFDCRITNHAGATPVWTMLQHLAVLAFNDTSAFEEIKDLFSCGNCDYKWMKYTKKVFIEEATNMIQQFLDLVSYNEDVREALGIPDRNNNYLINVVLCTIRVASYRLVQQPNIILDYTKLRECLIRLLRLILCHANTMKLQNNKGQNALHVFLDMGEAKNNSVCYDEDILESIKILLQHNVDVNAIDSKGNTPLHVANKYHGGRNKKIAEMLINWDAVADEKRVLRSCPTTHQDKAQRLVDNTTTEVTVVGKYRYCSQDRIGSGAFSTVFVAVRDEFVDGKSGTMNCIALALKRLEKATPKGDQFQREIKNFISLSEGCENVIKYYDNFDDSSFHYIVLALMDGDLYEFIANDNIKHLVKRNRAIHLQGMKDIITGLAHLHNNDYIHRDLNPGNILYTTSPTLHFKIADLGVTKNMSSLTINSARDERTPCWIAPELLVGQSSGQHTKQSDIFSLGLVLYYLYTLGSHPFKDLKDEEINLSYGCMLDTFKIHGVSHPECTSFFVDLLCECPDTRSRVNDLIQKPFFWSDRKRVEFLKVIGNQVEAIWPYNYRYSCLVQDLQKTSIGREVCRHTRNWHLWSKEMKVIYKEITDDYPNKKYRTDEVIHLLRFVRNTYAHMSERSREVQDYLDSNILLHTYPSLVRDVFYVIQRLDLRKIRRDINDVLDAYQ